LDGPAIEHVNGDKYWFINDKRHREDGPAAEYANGDKYWYINGVNYSQDEYLTEFRKRNLQVYKSL